MIRLFIVFLIYYSVNYPAYTQDPVSIQLIPIETPLPSTAYYILSDQNNLLWIATSSGVYHYNGYEFKHFTSADGLGDNEILRIYEDKKGRIWFQSVNGNPSFYLNGTIYNASNNEMLAKLKFNKMILAECEDEEGNMYIGSREFVYYQISKDDEVTRLSFIGEENFIWSNNNKPHFVTKKLHPGYSPVRGDKLNELVIIGVHQSLYQIHSDTIYEKVLTLPPQSQELIYLKIKNEHEVYIGTRNGLFIWKRNADTQLRHILQGLSVSSVEFDFEDNLWVTTLESGVLMIPSMDVNIYSTQNKLPQNNITCIEKDDSDNLWIGMAKDYYAILHPDGTMDSFRLKKKSTLNITNIRHFNGDTWLLSKSSISLIRENKFLEIGSYGNDLLVQSNGKFFLGQDYTILLNQDQFENHLLEISFNMTFRRTDYELVNARTNVIKEDWAGNVWLGTSKGLYRYRDSVLLYGNVDPLFNSPVRDIAIDNQNKIIYVATLNGLLVIKDWKLHTILDKNANLPNSECNAVFVDDDQKVWAAFGSDLISVQMDEGGFRFSNISDLMKIESSRIVDIDMVNSTMYLATETGLIYFDKTINDIFNVRPLVSFSDFRINEHSYLTDSIKDFQYDENDVTISYSGISYLSGALITYEYFLEGYDNEWQQTDERNIHYKSLSAGSYNFKIRAINQSGTVSEIQSISFTILPPIWNLLWFRLCALLIVISALALIWRTRIRLVRKKYEQENKTIRLEKEKVEVEKKLTELEQQAFRQQMNPHFIFNALNTIKGYYAENDVQKANEYISKFSKLLRTILENSKQIVSLSDEINAIKLYLELAEMRYENKFAYSIHVDDNIQAQETGIPPMLLQPFIENSIIHGISPKSGTGTITIRFYKEHEQLVCEVIDNGIGREAAFFRSKSIEHRSKATGIITEYLNALNKKDKANLFTIDIVDLFDQDHTSSGTKVVIRMPAIKIW